MASVFRQQYTKLVDGKRVRCKSEYWYIDYKTPDGLRKRVKGFKDKTATAQYAAKLEKESELAQAGVVDNYKEHRNRPLMEHLADFKQSLLAKGNTAKHAELTYQRANAVLIEKCGFAYIADIKASLVQNAVAGLQHDQKQIALSFQSQNFYLKSCQQFCRWMVQDRRTADSPLQHLQGKNVKLDRKHDRRALSANEVRRLLETTKAAPFRFKMSGADRAMLYRLTIESGLRADELRSLTVSSFDLQGRTVTVQAGDSKHRQIDRLPLRPDTADALAGLLCGKMPTVKVFNVPDKAYKMLKADLVDANISYCVDGKYADFHALRHTTGSLLAAAGVHPKVIQTIMRHSDINLTMSKYTHVFAGQESDAINSLPDLSLPSEQSQKQIKTGTDNQPIDVECAYTPAYKKLAKNAVFERNSSAMFGTMQTGQSENSQHESGVDKALSMAELGNECVSLSLADSGEKTNTPDRIRTPRIRTTENRDFRKWRRKIRRTRCAETYSRLYSG